MLIRVTIRGVRAVRRLEFTPSTTAVKRGSFSPVFQKVSPIGFRTTASASRLLILRKRATRSQLQSYEFLRTPQVTLTTNRVQIQNVKINGDMHEVSTKIAYQRQYSEIISNE